MMDLGSSGARGAELRPRFLKNRRVRDDDDDLDFEDLVDDGADDDVGQTSWVETLLVRAGSVEEEEMDVEDEDEEEDDLWRRERFFFEPPRREVMLEECESRLEVPVDSRRSIAVGVV